MGAHNLLNRHQHGGVIQPGLYVPKGMIKYLRPVALRRNVVNPLTRDMWTAITPLDGDGALGRLAAYPP